MELWKYVGKTITIYFKDKKKYKPMTGVCICYVSALDNYPEEVASIDLEVGARYYEIHEPLIDHIELIEEDNDKKE